MGVRSTTHHILVTMGVISMEIGVPSSVISTVYTQHQLQILHLACLPSYKPTNLSRCPHMLEAQLPLGIGFVKLHSLSQFSPFLKQGKQ